jgi:hypothetical protein
MTVSKEAYSVIDKCRKRINPGIFSTFIDWTVNLLKRNRVSNIKKELYNNAMDFGSSIQYLC